MVEVLDNAGFRYSELAAKIERSAGELRQILVSLGLLEDRTQEDKGACGQDNRCNYYMATSGFNPMVGSDLEKALVFMAGQQTSVQCELQRLRMEFEAYKKVAKQHEANELEERERQRRSIMYLMSREKSRSDSPTQERLQKQAQPRPQSGTSQTGASQTGTNQTGISNKIRAPEQFREMLVKQALYSPQKQHQVLTAFDCLMNLRDIQLEQFHHDLAQQLCVHAAESFKEFPALVSEFCKLSPALVAEGARAVRNEQQAGAGLEDEDETPSDTDLDDTAGSEAEVEEQKRHSLAQFRVVKGRNRCRGRIDADDDNYTTDGEEDSCVCEDERLQSEDYDEDSESSMVM